MRKLVPLFIASALAALCLCASAEDLVFFQSSTAGADAWSWGGARAKADGALLVITEDNAGGGYGDVYPSDRFPYIPNARLDADISSIIAGTYTIQILCFKGSVNFKTIDVCKDSKLPGTQSFKMADLLLPPETQSIMFKIWVSNQESASIRLKEFKYYLPIPTGSIVVDENFKDAVKWTATDVVMTPMAKGIEVGMAPSKTYGSIQWEKSFDKNSVSILLLHIPEAQSSVITIQLDLLDASGIFMQAVDAIKDVGAGWHGLPLSSLNLPAEASKFQIKIWTAGDTAARVKLERLMLIK